MGPILRRELIVLARRRATYSDRAVLAGLVLGALVGSAVVWDHLGRDRATGPGATRFAHAAFGLVVAVLTVLTVGGVPAAVAPGVAGERDRKTLDALLASGLSSAGVVAGVMAAGLVRTASGLAVGFSVLALMVPLAGIDPRLVALAFAGLAATAFAASALSAAVSVEAKDAGRAVGGAVGLVFGGWVAAPLVVVTLLPRLWPSATPWVYPVAVTLLDGSPMAVLANLVGLYRPSGLVEAVARMIGYEVLGGLAVSAWAVWRLRPASRALYDSEGRSVLRALRRTRWRSRPACGDDPVFWNETHARRGQSGWVWLLGVLCNVVMFAALARATYRFAAPAFREVLTFGYGAAPVGRVSPEIHPVVRALVTVVGKGSTLPGLKEGLARSEFNTILRAVTGFYFLMHVLGVAGYAAESISSERERDTWTGLIATPLTGREVLVGKMLGTAWRLRLVTGTMVGLWVVGLVTGAVHPLGFAAALVGLAVSGWFLLALGTYTSLWSRDRKEATNRVLPAALVMALSGMLLALLPKSLVSLWLGVGSMPVIGGLSLLSYEDVRGAFGRVPGLDGGGHAGGGGGRVGRGGLPGRAGRAGGPGLVAHPGRLPRLRRGRRPTGAGRGQTPGRRVVPSMARARASGRWLPIIRRVPSLSSRRTPRLPRALSARSPSRPVRMPQPP